MPVFLFKPVFLFFSGKNLPLYSYSSLYAYQRLQSSTKYIHLQNLQIHSMYPNCKLSSINIMNTYLYRTFPPFCQQSSWNLRHQPRIFFHQALPLQVRIFWCSLMVQATIQTLNPQGKQPPLNFVDHSLQLKKALFIKRSKYGMHIDRRNANNHLVKVVHVSTCALCKVQYSAQTGIFDNIQTSYVLS